MLNREPQIWHGLSEKLPVPIERMEQALWMALFDIATQSTNTISRLQVAFEEIEGILTNGVQPTDLASTYDTIKSSTARIIGEEEAINVDEDGDQAMQEPTMLVSQRTDPSVTSEIPPKDVEMDCDTGADTSVARNMDIDSDSMGNNTLQNLTDRERRADWFTGECQPEMRQSSPSYLSKSEPTTTKRQGNHSQAMQDDRARIGTHGPTTSVSAGHDVDMGVTQQSSTVGRSAEKAWAVHADVAMEGQKSQQYSEHLPDQDVEMAEQHRKRMSETTSRHRSTKGDGTDYRSKGPGASVDNLSVLDLLLTTSDGKLVELIGMENNMVRRLLMRL
jgi:hypothetical protein